MKHIYGLSVEQNQKYRYAIKCGYFDSFEQDQRVWKHTFVGRFIWKYPNRVGVLKRWTDLLGHQPSWEDMTDDNLRDFVDELKDSGLTPSSIKTMCAELKSVLNEGKSKVPSNEFMAILSISGIMATKAVYLTPNEVVRFLCYNPKTKIERYVHHNFSVCMLTGARLVDATRMTINNCDYETNMLSYIPQKTPGVIVRVPVDERRNLRAILSDIQERSCGLDVYNENVRKICERLNITTMCTATKGGRDVTEPKYKLVSSHTARRTFATNLYLAGVSIEDIALMMGHGTNTETTKRYICAERQLNRSVISYFQELQ